MKLRLLVLSLECKTNNAKDELKVVGTALYPGDWRGFMEKPTTIKAYLLVRPAGSWRMTTVKSLG
jgi:hypothetical protein